MDGKNARHVAASLNAGGLAIVVQQNESLEFCGSLGQTPCLSEAGQGAGDGVPRNVLEQLQSHEVSLEDSF